MQPSFSFLTRVVFQAASGEEPAAPKKACDFCRQKKVRCIVDGSSCLNCVARGNTCTFLLEPKPRGRKKKSTPSAHPSEQLPDFSIPHFHDLDKYSLSSK
ncbi:hypothetical protein DSO57_1027126 [Entomophthora muscae]|uniref:Uncharacterized protein n=2 Tax=Entomophthora muscae TaxID=34485 RepID=A0ACC2SNK0_9FUNG|nr:hypothetical protein DSO57_1035575 [Entomophthora muscae]KAJ9088032.1 hypothetical protein DSO57_1027126 [Entomophthora muscae]